MRLNSLPLIVLVWIAGVAISLPLVILRRARLRTALRR